MAAANDLGTGWNFPPRFFNNGKDVSLVSDEEDVHQELEILISTALKERLNYSDYGCDMKQFMFEEVNRGLVLEIQQMILNSIYDYEPRVQVDNIEVTQSKDNAQELLISIDYQIISTSSEENLEYFLSLG